VPARVPVILNPIAGGGRLLRGRADLEACAATLGIELQWCPTRQRGHATELAADFAAEGRELVLAYGGDGTYNEAARGLLGSPTAMGILPGGTTSVLAYELGVPRPAPDALATLVAGRNRAMRVGRTSHGDVVLLMLSAGPDALVLDRLRPGLKRLGGRAAVAVQAVLETLRPTPLPRLRLRLAGRELSAGWAIVGKSACYAGPYHATPAADPFADRFEAVVQTRAGRGAAVLFALGIPAGRHVRRPGVLRFVVDRVALEVEHAEGTVPYQVDGDVAGDLPVEIWVDPEPLLLRLPA
jgi:diacylglycerol kinase (ATP)